MACHIPSQPAFLVVAGGVIQADVVEGPFGPAQVDGVEDGYPEPQFDVRSPWSPKDVLNCLSFWIPFPV